MKLKSPNEDYRWVNKSIIPANVLEEYKSNRQLHWRNKAKDTNL